MPSTKLLGVIVALVLGGFLVGAWFFYGTREEVVVDNTGAQLVDDTGKPIIDVPGGG